MDEVLIHTNTCMNIENIMLSDADTKGHLYKISTIEKSIEIVIILVVAKV